MRDAVHVIGGGTVFHIRPHLALSAPAYGAAARFVASTCAKLFFRDHEVNLHLTRMAGGPKELETNADIDRLLTKLTEDPSTKVIILSAALCDFEGEAIMSSCWDSTVLPAGKDRTRLQTDYDFAGTGIPAIKLKPSEKLIRKVRQVRKDIFLVGFKTTAGGEVPTTEDVMFERGLKLLKTASCNLVLVNDLHTKMNMIVTPEQARYCVTPDRDKALVQLTEIAAKRSQLHFTRSSVISYGEGIIPWSSSMVPETLRTVVNHCIEKGAYKEFMGSTVGHFAAKLDNNMFLTSIRRSNFNKMDEWGLVRVVAKDNNEVVAYGAKPSVGGQSQRIIFAEHPDTDSIVHFHCRKKPGSEVPVRPQWMFECGSHECGTNTSMGLKKFGNLYAVMLDEHGPNIVFDSKTVRPEEVISFIEGNFDLTHPTSQPA